MVDSQTLDLGLYALRSSETIVSPAAAAYEIAKPLHESVRIALDEYVHPQDFASRGVRCRADNSFSPFTRTAVSSTPITLARLRARPAARVPPRFMDIAPRAHARYREAEGGERSAATVRAPARAPPIRASAGVCPTMAIPSPGAA